jgi:hypothetical protein
MAQLLDPDEWGQGPKSGESRPGSGGAAARNVAAPPDGMADDRPPGPRRTGATAQPKPTSAAEPAWNPFAEQSPTTAAEPRRGTPPPSRPPRRKSRLPLILAVMLVVLALAAAGIWAAASGLLPFGGASADGGAEPEASAPATSGPDPSATPTTPAEPAGTALPASCDELYSDGMQATIEGDGLVLNPAWSQEDGLRLPTNDEELSALLDPLPRLDCGWLPPEGGGEVGVITSVAQVTEEQQAAVEARFLELGWAQIEELGSVRYVLEEEGGGNRLGQSHVLRNGLWFATGWVNYGPTGYTADMVAQVFG